MIAATNESARNVATTHGGMLMLVMPMLATSAYAEEFVEFQQMPEEGSLHQTPKPHDRQSAFLWDPILQSDSDEVAVLVDPGRAVQAISQNRKAASRIVARPRHLLLR